MRVVSSKTFFLSTANRDEGTSYAPLFQLPLGALAREDGQMLRLTLVRWSCFVGWPNVNDTNNAFIFRNDDSGASTTITLESGNYTYVKLAKFITAAYGGVVASYDTIANKMVFQFTARHTLIFLNDCYKVLGYVDGADVAADGSGRMISTGLLKGRATDRVLIGVRGVSPVAGGNLENISTGELRASDLLAAITISAAPYTYQSYTNVTGEEMSLMISDRAVQKIGFEFMDGGSGEAATFMDGFDSELVLRADVLQTGDASHQNVQLSKISEYLRLQLLTSHLKLSDLPPEYAAEE
jgi:hypothetical protein